MVFSKLGVQNLSVLQTSLPSPPHPYSYPFTPKLQCICLPGSYVHKHWFEPTRHNESAGVMIQYARIEGESMLGSGDVDLWCLSKNTKAPLWASSTPLLT